MTPLMSKIETLATLTISEKFDGKS
jgi:hypothetical protein